jgi:hypothetical protein
MNLQLLKISVYFNRHKAVQFHYRQERGNTRKKGGVETQSGTQCQVLLHTHQTQPITNDHHKAYTRLHCQLVRNWVLSANLKSSMFHSLLIQIY